MTYTNLSYAIFLILGFLYLYEWIGKSDAPLLVVSGLMFGLSTWVRDPEPFWALGCIVMIGFAIFRSPHPFRRRILFVVIFLCCLFSIKIPWYLYKSITVNKIISIQAAARPRQVEPALRIKPNEILVEMLKKETHTFQRVRAVVAHVNENVINKHRSAFVVFLVVLSFLLLIRRHIMSTDVIAQILVIIFSLLLIYSGTYVFSILFPKWWDQIGGSLQRMTFFYYPLVLYFAFNVLLKKTLIKDEAQ